MYSYVVGDIHGEISKLRSLVNNILARDSNPTFIFIGDYIDKGEDAYQTLKYLVELDSHYNCVFLWGNHEYCWENLTLYEDYLMKYGGAATISSFGEKTIVETNRKLTREFSNLFGKLKKYYFIQDYLVVHSGIPINIYDTPEMIKELPTESFLFNRYDFIGKQTLFDNKYKVIFGHTGFYTPYYDGYKIGIDTCACYLKEQPLTAFSIENEEFIDSLNNIVSLNDYPVDICPIIPRIKPWRL